MSEPVHGDLLERVTRTLQELGHTFTEYKRDRNGKYAAQFRAKGSGLPFIVVAKGSQIMGDTISFHRTLLETWKAPIVLAWLQPGLAYLQWYVYDPSGIMVAEYMVNFRDGVEMVNFSIFLGVRWDPLTQGLQEVWDAVKRKSRQHLGRENY